jgi:hypothetical protein
MAMVRAVTKEIAFVIAFMPTIKPQVYPPFNPGFFDIPQLPDDNLAMGTNLKSYIENGLRAIGKDQTWLADKLELSDNAISKWKRTGQIKMDNFIAVVKLLGLDGAPYIEEMIPKLERAETELISDFRLLEDDDKASVLRIAAKLAADRKAEDALKRAKGQSSPDQSQAG